VFAAPRDAPTAICWRAQRKLRPLIVVSQRDEWEYRPKLDPGGKQRASARWQRCKSRWAFALGLLC